MGECNLDQIERIDQHGPDFTVIVDEIYYRRKTTVQNVDVAWRSEIPCTGENGNDIASGNISIKQSPKQPKRHSLLSRLLSYYEILGKAETN